MNLWNDRFWYPMLLKEVSKPFDDDNYLYEIKFDGTRAIIFASNNNVTIINRHGKDVTYLYPELQKIKEIVKRKTIFDGEIVLFKNNIPSFNDLQERAHLKDKVKIKNQSISNPVVFICFDILYDNKNLTDIPLIKRKEMLDKYRENDVFIKSFYKIKEGINLFKETTKLSLEGIVAKKVDSPYIINKRSDYWLKIKNLKEEEFFIGGYIVNKNNVSFLLGELRKNKFFYVGKVSMAKKYDFVNKVLSSKSVNLSPFINFNAGNVIYIKPNYKIKVKYLERTENNHLRQPFISK
ncbi:MAG: hypothetical protein IJO33_01730 [Bacilli bacterium]|nr:hypothetical protein [Bacilli bacterium]